MPLGLPPAPVRLARLPRHRLVGSRLWRVFRKGRALPWWFESASTDRAGGGRFDLPAPDGSCYLGTSISAAVLGAFQHHSRGVLPASELAARQLAVTICPPDAPAAAALTAAKARAAGVTAALWSAQDRPLTQSWAVALRRAGWRAIYHGVQHDPTGTARAVTLFDREGQHLPYDDPAWQGETYALVDEPAVATALDRYGYVVTRSDPDLPVVALDDLTAPRGRRHRGR